MFHELSGKSNANGTRGPYIFTFRVKLKNPLRMQARFCCFNRFSCYYLFIFHECAMVRVEIVKHKLVLKNNRKLVSTNRKPETNKTSLS